ncbi:MAG: hypothetical protein ABFR82_15835 [Nitrospirota bacterium]
MTNMKLLNEFIWSDAFQLPRKRPVNMESLFIEREKGIWRLVPNLIEIH